MLQAVVNGISYLGNRVGNPLPANNAGAINAILPHPTDVNTILVGSVNGGIWKTTNGGVNWTVTTDNMPSLSISHLSYDLTDPSFNTILASVGSVSNSIGVSGAFTGVYLSTNAGSSWTALSPGDFNSNGIDLVASFKIGTRIVGCMKGWVSSFITQPLIISNSNGAAGGWTFAGPTSTPKQTQCTDLIYIPSKTTFVAGIQKTNASPTGPELWISTDNGSNWARIASFAISNTLKTTSSVTLAASIVNGNALYAFVGGITGAALDQELYVCSSISASCTFVKVAIPNQVANQYQNNLVALADPADATRIYIGGSFDSGAQKHFLRCDGVNFATGVATCNPLTGSDGSDCHADSRCLIMDPNGDLLQSDDGGIWRRSSPSTASGIWTSLNGDMRALECTSATYDFKSGLAACGAQDNGLSMGYPGRSGGGWLALQAGDGADIRMATQFTPTRLYGSSQYLGYSTTCTVFESAFEYVPMGNFPYATQAERAGTTVPQIQTMCTALGGTSRNFPFYTDYEINQYSSTSNLNIMIIGLKEVWEFSGTGAPTKIATWTANCGGTGGLALGIPSNPDLAWVAACQKVFFRSAAGLLTDTNFPNFYPIDIDVDQANGNVAYVLNQAATTTNWVTTIYKTINAGGTWTPLSSNIATVAPPAVYNTNFLTPGIRI